MAIVVIPDYRSTSKVGYSKEGLTAHRVFRVTGLADTTGYDVVPIALSQPGVPARGDEHPYYNGEDDVTEIMADVIEATNVDRDGGIVDIEIDYKHLNAMTQEPSDDGDVAAALLTMASTLQTIQRATDVAGNAMRVYYTADTLVPTGAPACIIYNQQGQPVPNQIGANAPFVNAKAATQQAGTILRFMRREQQMRNGLGYVGFYNDVDWPIAQIGGGNMTQFGALCTRIENVTQDEGISWIVTYEFQIAQSVNLGAGTFNLQTPAASPAGFTDLISGWDMVAYYVIPSGFNANNPTSTPENALYASSGQIPLDAKPTVFAVYGQAHFQDLSLCGEEA